METNFQEHRPKARSNVRSLKAWNRDLESRPPTSKQDKPQRCEIHHKIRFPFHTTLTWNERTVRQHLPLITGCLR